MPIKAVKTRKQKDMTGVFGGGSVRVREPRPQPMRKGVDQMEVGRMITLLMTSDSSSKEAVIRAVISRPFRSPFLTHLVSGGTRALHSRALRSRTIPTFFISISIFQ
jgi:hypothetical protein